MGAKGDGALCGGELAEHELDEGGLAGGVGAYEGADAIGAE